MKNCEQIHSLLTFYAESALSLSEKVEVEDHLRECEEARQELAKLKFLRQTLKEVPEPPMPPDLHVKIMARVRGKVQPLPIKRNFWAVPSWSLAAAAVLAFFFVNHYQEWREKLNTPLPENPPVESTPAVNQPTTAGTAKNPFPSTKDLALETSDKTKAEKRSVKVPRKKSQNSKKVEFAEDRMAAASEQKEGVKQALEMTQPRASVPQVEKGFASNDTNSAGSKTAAVRAAAPSSQTLAEANQPSAVSAPAPAAPRAFSAPSSPFGAAALPPSASGVWSGDNSPSGAEVQELITDAGTFRKYWGELQPNQALPEVDFTKQAVVLLMAGSKPTAGYSIHTIRLEAKDDLLAIHYTLDSPPAGAVVSQVLTSPWSLQVIAKPSKPVIFTKD